MFDQHVLVGRSGSEPCLLIKSQLSATLPCIYLNLLCVALMHVTSRHWQCKLQIWHHLNHLLCRPRHLRREARTGTRPRSRASATCWEVTCSATAAGRRRRSRYLTVTPPLHDPESDRCSPPGRIAAAQHPQSGHKTLRWIAVCGGAERPGHARRRRRRWRQQRQWRSRAGQRRLLRRPVRPSGAHGSRRGAADSTAILLARMLLTSFSDEESRLLDASTGVMASRDYLLPNAEHIGLCVPLTLYHRLQHVRRQALTNSRHHLTFCCGPTRSRRSRRSRRGRRTASGSPSTLANRPGSLR